MRNTSAPLAPKLHCPVASQCGGCPRIALHRDEQRRQYESQVEQLLDDVGLHELCTQLTFHPAAAHAGYRNRIRLRISDDGKVGFFNAQKQASCAVLSESLRRSLEGLSTTLEALGAPLSNLAHLELRQEDLDRHASVFFTHRPGCRVTASDRQLLTAALVDTLVGFDDTPGPDQRYPLVHDLYARVPLGAFMQVNSLVNQALIECIVGQAQARHLTSVWDLYCGSGNFLLPLLAQGLKGTGVERDLVAIASLRRAADEQGLSGTFVASDALDWVQDQVHQGATPPDLLICDPPRAGLKEALVPAAQVGARFIALCSCNPRSLARDLAALKEHGYVCQSLTLFDMFEHTAQVEVLAWLEQGAPSTEEEVSDF